MKDEQIHIFPYHDSVRVYIDNDKEVLELKKSKYPQMYEKFESVFQEILDWHYENKIVNRLKKDSE